MTDTPKTLRDEFAMAALGALAVWDRWYPTLPVGAEAEDDAFGPILALRCAVARELGLNGWEDTLPLTAAINDERAKSSPALNEGGEG